MTRRIARLIGALFLATLAGCGAPGTSVVEPVQRGSIRPTATTVASVPPTATVATRAETAGAAYPTMYFVESAT